MPLRDMDREQMWLLPPSLDDLLPLDHPARFVAEFVDALDKEGWAELGVEIAGDPLGAPAYHPRALLSVWLYGFMTGVWSCRKLEAACRDQIPYLWLTGWQHPDHNTLWRFYKGHRQAMRKLFERTVRTAVTMKLVDLAVQAVDGTKVGANAAGDRTYDAEELGRLLDRVEKAIADLEAQNEAGEDAAVANLPEELADKENLREAEDLRRTPRGEADGTDPVRLPDESSQLPLQLRACLRHQSEEHQSPPFAGPDLHKIAAQMPNVLRQQQIPDGPELWTPQNVHQLTAAHTAMLADAATAPRSRAGNHPDPATILMM